MVNKPKKPRKPRKCPYCRGTGYADGVGPSDTTPEQAAARLKARLQKVREAGKDKP